MTQGIRFAFRALGCGVVLAWMGCGGSIEAIDGGPRGDAAVVDGPAPDASTPPDASATDGGAADARVDAAGPDCDQAPSDTCAPSCRDLPSGYIPVASPPANPPSQGTVWFDPDIITASDPTSFQGLTYRGTGSRLMFDRRTNAFETYVAHLFDARFGTTVAVEVQVNPEFSAAEAEAAATEYATVIGRLPGFLFAEIETVWIHRGMQPFGGGNNNLLIHTGMAASYLADGVLEETFIHEATHTSLDGAHANQANWRAAQTADGVSISTYGRDNPTREDLAETVGPYLAVRFRASRIGAQLRSSTIATIPNRLEYLDCLGLSMALVP